MKNVTFDRNKASYDRYERLWIEKDFFLHFESGEVSYTHIGPDPEFRRHYPEYGVTIFMPGDTHMPKLYTTDGHAVPAAQLNTGGGNPYLLWDHNHNMVVRLTRLHQNTTVPRDLRHFACYWPAPDSKPVAGSILYAPPNVLSPEQKEFMKECKALVPTVVAMRQDVRVLEDAAKQVKAASQGEVQDAITQGVPPIRFLEAYTWGCLNQLRDGGASWLVRTPIEVPYLVTK